MQLVTLDDAPDANGQPLFVMFVNTLHWYEGEPIELIGNDAEFNAWLVERALHSPDVTGSLPAVHRLREHLRAITESLALHRTPAPPDMEALKLALGAAPGHLALIGADTPVPQLAFATEASDAQLFNLRVALSLATFLESGDRRRLKLCANPGCGFAFLDTSTNATRRWCDMRYCGNRLKARAFRSRGRQQVRRHLDGASA
jgi:predicted RNA-binding Zn ribbon-like protein